MSDYLFHLSAIWVISLVVFEVLFVREASHSANRTYLLLTLLGGLVVPLIRWGQAVGLAVPVYNLPSQIGAAPGYASSGHVADAAVVTTSSIPWLTIIYLTGVLCAMAWLLKDVVVIYRLYRVGIKRRMDKSVVVETRKQHGPFSILGLVFISDSKDYTESELHMILQHEQRHIALYHGLDVMLLSLLRVAFWFHPLVYWYSKRLKAVHEYQADRAVAEEGSTYGVLLLTQTMLHNAPALTHAFFSNGMRARFGMLQRGVNGRVNLVKYVAVIPVLILVMLSCTKNKAVDQIVRKGNKVYFRGNEFTEGVMPNGVTSVDSFLDKLLNGEGVVVGTGRVAEVPVKMNGERIFDYPEVSQPPKLLANGQSLKQILLNRMQSALSKLPNGDYNIEVHDLIVDKNGGVVYYQTPSVERHSTVYIKDDSDFKAALAELKSKKPDQLEASVQQKFLPDIMETLNGLSYSPALYNGKPVICYGQGPEDGASYFTVKDGTISIKTLGGKATN